MKCFIVLATLVAVARAGILAAPAHVLAAPAALVSTGTSSQYRSQDNIGNYAFGYNEDHATGGTFRREAGSPGAVTGSYGLRDIDGRVRVVNYVADALGFRANIQTNEPGVEPKDPASTLINKGVVAAAPVVAAAAPVAVAAAPAARLVAPAAQYVHSPYAVPQAVASPYYASAAYATPFAPFGGLLIRK